MTGMPPTKRRLFPSSVTAKRRKVTRATRVKKTELKFADLILDSLSSGGNAAASLSALITSGAGEGQRVGSKIKIVKIECKYNAANWTAFKDDGMVTRIIMHKDPSDTPAISDAGVFHDPADTILLHEELTSPGTGMAGAWTWYGPLNVEFSGDTTTVRKNNVYAQVHHGAGAAGTIRCRFRVWYVDP